MELHIIFDEEYEVEKFKFAFKGDYLMIVQFLTNVIIRTLTRIDIEDDEIDRIIKGVVLALEYTIDAYGKSKAQKMN